jgi:hypothetical protein
LPFFWANRIEIFRSFEILEVSYTRSSTFFLQQSYQNLQTFLHSDNPEFFLGVVFYFVQSEWERERERIYQNLQVLGISDNQSFCLFVWGVVFFFFGSIQR